MRTHTHNTHTSTQHTAQNIINKTSSQHKTPSHRMKNMFVASDVSPLTGCGWGSVGH